MPLCLGRVEDVFALFFKSAVWIRADEKQKCIGLSISYSFLELFKNWTGKGPSVRKVFSSKKKAGTGKIMCVVCCAIVWFGAVRYENASERAAR